MTLTLSEFVIRILSKVQDYRVHKRKMKMKMKIALYQSQREIHTVASRAAPGDLVLRFHPKDYQQKFTYYYGHPSKSKPRPMLLNPSVPVR